MKKTTMVGIVAAAIFVVWGILNCGDEKKQDPACAAGEERDCTCADGTMGIRACSADGIWSRCDGCMPGGGGDGGTADGGGLGGCAPNCPIGEMVTVPAGSFLRGCNTAVDSECEDTFEWDLYAEEVAQFEIDEFEVTTAEFQACIDQGGCEEPVMDPAMKCNLGRADRAADPINCVTVADAMAFCAWENKRLPNEVEWEKAARGTDGRKYPWGNDSLDCIHAVHSANGCAHIQTAAVGTRPAGDSPYGVADMIGNVWEWVIADNGDLNSLRGGSWKDVDTFILRTSKRGYANGGFTYENVGFRCAR